ncbi:uncharacterized protein [Amphiura filiformis]|uniref:uncharacterized protein n=1 Tax=Amphiura filiformis TaxID=82378 RepID=UPI003B20CF39
MLGSISAFVAVVLLMSSGSLAIEPSFRNPPSDTTGVKGHDVTMYCQVAHKGKSNLYWHCNSDNGYQDVTVGPNENNNPSLKRFVIDNSGASVGQYNLIITDVTELDSGNCSCIIDTGIGNAMEAGARLTVMSNISVPSNQLCTINKHKTPGQQLRVFTAEDDTQLMCQSRNGVPLADIHWEIVRTGSNGTGVEIFSSISTTATTITAIADYKITPADDGAYFQCIHTHVALTEPSICSPLFRKNRQTFEIGSPDQPIQVKYRPVLRFIPASLKVTPFETREETLRCVYDANPDLDVNGGPSINGGDLKWNYTTPGKEDSVDLSLVQTDYGKIIECVATNELGSSVITLKIDSTGFLPTWIMVVIIGGGGLLLFFIIALTCCICFSGDGDHDDEKPLDDADLSRQGSFQRNELEVEENLYGDPEMEGDDNDDPDMININEFMFEGGEMRKDNIGYVDDDDSDDDIVKTKMKNKKMKKKASSNKYDHIPINKV